MAFAWSSPKFPRRSLEIAAWLYFSCAGVLVAVSIPCNGELVLRVANHVDLYVNFVHLVVKAFVQLASAQRLGPVPAMWRSAHGMTHVSDYVLATRELSKHLQANGF